MRTMKSSTARTLNETDVLIGVTYIENNLKIEATARQLHFHRQTIQHHLKRIQRITGYDLRNPFDAVDFYDTYHGRGETYL